MNQMLNQQQEAQAQQNFGGGATQIQEPQAVQEVQQVSQTEADFPGVLNRLMPQMLDNKDLVNFAYYLYRQELVAEHTHDFDEWVGIRQKVNFCNCTQWRSASPSASMNLSKLDQLYTVDMFTGEEYDLLWEKKENLEESICGRCRYCKGDSGEGFPFCPYFLCHVIVKAAEAFGTSPETIFDDILGEAKIPFRGRAVNKLEVAIPAEEIQGIHSKSAYGAHLLLAGKMVAIQSIEENMVHYTHIPLCRGDQKKSIISNIISMWKTGSGVSCTLHTADMTSLLYAKTEGCQKCAFQQCPHKLAAYIVHLGKKYNLDPIDLAYYLATSSTYAGLNTTDNYQFDKYLEHIRNAPMQEESKAEFLKMVHFIAGRKVNRSIPFLPFNIALSSPDKEKAHEIVADFCNALWHFDYYRQGKDLTVRKDLYLSTLAFGDLCEEYRNAKAGTTFVLHDVFLLLDKESGFKQGHHRLLKIMEDRREDIMSIVIGEKEELATFFSTYPVFQSKIFTKTLEMVHMDGDAILLALEDKLTRTFTIPEEVRQRLEQYIHLTYPSSAKKGMVYVADLYEKLLFAHYNYNVNADAELRTADIPYVKPPRSEQEIFAEINRLTGLEGVKKELQDVNYLVKYNIKTGAHNKNPINLHMIFTGNPGTGKTTVARLMAEILYSIGFIRENKVVVCSSKDLVGEYMGTTTPKTASKCEQAYNGVLFIDEAYQLNPYVSGRVDEYREECIAELIQQMENNRDKLVVIFAGYTEEMADFLNRANTGLRSRIGRTIHFPDYSSEELMEIFTKIVEDAGMTLGEGAKSKALEIFNTAKRDSERFGNARFARSLFERSLLQHAAITANMDKEDPQLRILQRGEITMPSV